MEARPRRGRLRSDAQLDADGRLGNPRTGVAPSFTPELVAFLADDRDVRLAIQASGLSAERLDKERARCEMNDSRSLDVPGVELHTGSIPYDADDSRPLTPEGPPRRRNAGGPEKLLRQGQISTGSRRRRGDRGRQAGEIQATRLPQGTFAEGERAGGAGIGGVLYAGRLGTMPADEKEERMSGCVRHERAATQSDVALIAKVCES